MVMVKETRTPASEIKGIRSFGAGAETIISELKGRPIPDSKIKNIRSFVADRIAPADKAEK